MTINNRIRIVRKELGLTLEAFGGCIGITKGSVSQMESGKINPSEQTIRSICREFNVSEGWLRSGEGEMFIKSNRNLEIEDFMGRLLREKPETFRRRFISALARLDESDWGLVARFVEDLGAELNADQSDED